MECSDPDYCWEMREAVRRARDAMETTNPTIGTLIDLAERGNGASAGKRFRLLDRELHRLANRQLARQGDVSISARTLIHQGYLSFSSFRSSDPDEYLLP